MDNDTDSQTDQPASPTGNIAATTSPNGPGHSHAPSPDPPSTRPNPFDDSDLSSRKRRRTSGSASPPPSPAAAVSATASLSAGASASSGASTSEQSFLDARPSVQHSSTGAMGQGQQSENVVAPGAHQTELPHTPKQPVDSPRSSSPTPLSSSKVTINIKKAADPVTQPAVTSLSSDSAPPLLSTSTFDGQQDMAIEEERNSEPGEETRQMSDSASPPVELIAISDNENEESDDEMAFSVEEKATRLLRRGIAPLDPTLHFPYIQNDEEPSMPLLRFIHHFKADSPVNIEALVLLQTWIQDYLGFARSADKFTVLNSRHANKRFWLMFPEAMLQLLIRGSELVKPPELRSTIISIYYSFACLTALMAALDTAELRQEQAAIGIGNENPPHLFSAKYLQQLHDIIATDASSTSPGEEKPPSSEWIQTDVGPYLLAKLQSSQGGSVAALSQLAVTLTSFIPSFPKLMEHLAAIAKILGSCLRESVRILATGGDQLSQAQDQLEIGTTAWNHISTCLEIVIDKHVTQLGVDTATTLIPALTDILKWTLRGEHKSALDTMHEHVQRHPDLPFVHGFDAVAWQWRLGVLDRLIRCGQMQLRVMAITRLCNDLVSVWKSTLDTGDESSNRFLSYIGECLLETRLIDYILGPNCHPEIIVESSNVLGFLIVTKLYKQDHTDRLWQSLMLCQDPRITDALARMVTSITNLFDYDGLLGWCQKFQAVPLEAFTPAMRTLWDNIMNDLISKCQSERQTPSFEPFDLCLRLLREASVCTPGSQVADPDLQMAAIQKLRELLSTAQPDDLEILHLSCLDDIAKKSPTALGSLWCLSMTMRGNLPNEVENLTKNHDLARLIVEELAHAVQAGQQAGAFAVISGTPNVPRRDLIASIIQFQPAALNNGLGAVLLDIIVGPKSPCSDDRKAGWFVITNVMRKVSMKNAFLQACFARYLPSLPASCFSDGMLDFVRERVLCLAEDGGSFALDDPESLSHSGIEELWRIILEAEDSLLVSRAISTLAVDLYLENSTINSYSVCRSKKVHISLLNRCLDQMKQAAKKINGNIESLVGDGDESMVLVTTTEEIAQQERVFRRSLQLMRFFLEKYQVHGRFSVADFRPLMSTTIEEMQGESACLQYQAFDNHDRSEIKPLSIGLGNSIASLLTRLKSLTHFDNYRIYYRGQSLLPEEHQATKSLEELGIRDGFILVKREEDSMSLAGYIRPGSSPLEIEILGHFQDLWEYLSMDEKLAEEVYDFLVKLPADGHFMLQFDSDQTDYSEVFLKGQTFKTLYGLHALSDYIEAAERSVSAAIHDEESTGTTPTFHQQALLRSLSLIVKAISDPEMLDEMPAAQQLRISGAFLQIYVRLFTEYNKHKGLLELADDVLPHPTRLVDILTKVEGDTSDASLTLIESACTAVLRVGSVNREFWSTTVTSTSFLDALKSFLLKDPRKAVRQTIVELVEDIASPQAQLSTPESGYYTSSSQEVSPVSLAICTSLTESLPLCLVHSSQPEEYFRALLYLVSCACMTTPRALDIEHLSAVTRDLLLKHTCIELIDRPDVADPVAAGLVGVLHLKYLPIPPPRNTISRLFWRHLFPRKRRSERDYVPPVILNSNTRKKLYDIIFRCVRCDLSSFVHMLGTLNGLVPFYVDEPDDPYLYDLPYQFDRSRAIRASCGYVGLRNLSNTCYLNSLLTQLFMNTQFRRFIMSVVIQDPQATQQLLFYTQKLFGYMQESYQRFVDPFDVVASIKTYDDTLIDIHSQMDVDEFYNLLFDRWEGQLLNKGDKKQLRSFYGGRLVQQVKSKECEHISERLEPFSAIQCDIKGKATLEESLQAYVDGEVMEGENKYKCSTCDRHVDAVKRACLKDVPDHLIFHLKRFDFNLRTLQRRKINDYFTFPHTLDLAPYTVEYLNAEEGAARKDIFELVGILVHSGTAESGHYYSYIRERVSGARPSWVEFNDESVLPWDPSLMENATFGGPDPQPSLQDVTGMIYDKTYSAYMLFYQRALSLYPDSQPSNPTADGCLSPVKILPPLKEHIINENKVLLRRQCLFDPSHSFFVQQFFGHSLSLGESRTVKSPASICDEERDDDSERGRRPDKISSAHALQNLAIEVSLSHFDQVVSRTKDGAILVESFSSMLKSAVAKCYDCAIAFYNYFKVRHAAFRSLMQRNPDPDVRSFAGNTLVLAASKIRSGLPRYYHCPAPARTGFNQARVDSDDDWDDSEMPQSVLQGMMGIFNHLWRFFHVHIRSWDEYFDMMLAFAKLGALEVGRLLADNYLIKLLQIITADPAMELQPNYQRMVNNLLRRFNSKPASYAGVLALIDYLMAQLEPALSADVIVDEARDRRDVRQPFPWTSEEVQAVHSHPDSSSTSLFIEKLLEIDQVPDLTNKIIGRLVKSGEELDLRIFNTLRKKIQGETTAQAMDSSIRAAGRYAECSESLERVHILIRHVCTQSRSLQHNEGSTFLDFVNLMLFSRRPKAALALPRRHYMIQAIPTWAPYMLVYGDEHTRGVAERLINERLFPPMALNTVDGHDDDAALEQETLEHTIRQLGIKCLVYLRDVHVKGRIQLERSAAGNILRVISSCVPFYEGGDEINDYSEDSAEFRAIQGEITTPLQKLLVDEIEDDGSDWDGSCGSSEFMEVNVGALGQS
ncbi:Peptidase C19, ubiquitin carboxyl-terminal hydrolase 2 [Metarhizium rileyi]|uniref:Peptidase C19, ubiquitin carboxyl-terminal hydrolase 2 n=1 Tax=Metarhizium rileyi (strain RCEF 4871) TaxID=1649241 RepID=A0A167F5F0_METRR|nr:Peptidase C19, ubiquitin carboxyl-terminal hydrolase 2 [Metarhizium rileyi RCEF 4871]